VQGKTSSNGANSAGGSIASCPSADVGGFFHFANGVSY
jgi:hypothetical protein